MTTPTLQIAESVGLVEDDYFGRSHFNELTEAKLQAFRSAVEAESDAERMKQPAILWVDMHEVEKLRSRSLPVRCIHEQYDADYSPLYAQPFPSTEQLQLQLQLEDAVSHERQTAAVAEKFYQEKEQLQQRVKELADAIQQRLAADKYCAMYSHLPEADEECARAAQDADDALRKALANTQGEKQ